MPLKLMLKITDVKSPLTVKDLNDIKVEKLVLGKVDYYEPSHSFNHQMGQVLGLFFKGAALVAGFKEVGGGTNAESAGAYYQWAGQAAGVITGGIVVGRDNTGESINDYKLGTICSNGSAANNLSYSNSPLLDPYVVTTTTYLTANRVVMNISAATVTIAEVGIYCYNAVRTFCLIRDVLGATIDITVGSSKLIQYIITSVN